MITKYVGSVKEFINCESVAFVNVVNDVTLIESEISEYSPTHIYFSRVKLISRDSTGVFTAKFTRDEQVGFVINYVVMYNSIGTPIGFTNLTQDINLYKYNIESITLSFDFTIINKISTITVDISYTSHELLSSMKKAHLNQFEENLGVHRAVSKSELESGIKSKSSFSSNYLDVVRDEQVMYRYSGRISLDNSRFQHNEWLIKKPILDTAKFFELVETSIGKALILTYEDSIKFISPSIQTNYNLIIDSYFRIGRNVILAKVGDGKYKVYSVEDLIKGKESPLKTSSYTEAGVLVPEDLVINPEIVKNPITKDLMFYETVDSNIVPLDSHLEDILSDFGKPKFNEGKLIYADKGMMLTAQLDDLGLIKSIGYYSYSLPGYSTSKGLLPRYESIDILSNNISQLFYRVCRGTKPEEITFITKDLFLVNNSMCSYKDFYEFSKIETDPGGPVQTKHPDAPRPTIDENVYFILDKDYREKRGKNKYLIENASDFNYDRESYKCEYKLKIRPFIGDRIGLKNLDKVSKTARFDSRDKTILTTSYKGGLYGFISSDEYYRLGRL